MINARKLSYSYPQKTLYNNITFSIEADQHCAFIGTSGSGKSTLIDIILNPENYLFDGKLDLTSHCKIGYVSQFSDFTSSETMTVYDYIAKDFIHLQNEIASICKALETATDIDDLLEDYQMAMDAFEAIDGDRFESHIDKNLNLAMLGEHKHQLISELSGGEFKLVQVIKEMLLQPHLMIMDEPDVFLDFENLNALKDLINAHKGSLLVITHNRYLLNHCFNKILHLENKDIQEFDGKYIDYTFALLQKKIELQELSIADDLEIERNEKLIENLREAATNNAEKSFGKSLKARVKIKERLEARRIKAPFVDIKQPAIDFPNGEILSDTIALDVTNYSLSFDSLLLDDVNFEIASTDKVALIGNNGTGKTTLFREIYNLIAKPEKSNSSIRLHDQLQLGYLSQVQGECLNEDNTPLDEFYDLGFQSDQSIIDYLSDFCFSKDMVFQKINSLSGGEKNLLQLAKISVLKTNFLLLDEPTSHLDTYSQLSLEQAINNYPGGVFMISHDYYTIANCMDYVLLIENQTIRRLSLRKFRKMIYKGHFDKDYLLTEQKKKEIEGKIELALSKKNFELAKKQTEQLEPLLDLL